MEELKAARARKAQPRRCALLAMQFHSIPWYMLMAARARKAQPRRCCPWLTFWIHMQVLCCVKHTN